MTVLYVVLACAVIVGILAVFYEIRKLRQARGATSDQNQQVLMEWLKEMRESQQQTSATLQTQLQRQSSEINERLNKAAVELGKVQEHTQSMKELNEILKSPKLRGNVGEDLMKNILAQVLPKANFKLQYGFKSGEKVDAVIVTKAGLIPIDSKFPLEKYLAAQKAPDADKAGLMKEFYKQVKKHIDDISKKYIRPSEETVDFAFMYVPGEPVFYELYNESELVDYGSQKKVILVSPNSFVYLLKIVLVGLEGEQAEERSKLVLRELQSIQNDTAKLGGDLGVLNRHLTNAKNIMESVDRSYTQVKTRVDSTGRLGEASGADRKDAVKKQLEGLAELPEELPEEPVSSSPAQKR